MIFLQAQPDMNIWSVLLPFIVMFGVFYLFLLRPQQAQQKKRRQMLSELRRGDKIVTVAGVHGEITAIQDDIITVRIAESVEVKMNRSGVGHKQSDEQSAD